MRSVAHAGRQLRECASACLKAPGLRGSVLPACRRLVSTEVRAQHLAFTVDVTGELVVRDVATACLARASSCSSSVERDGPRSSV